ncbi:hypothetical protein [Ruegeria sp.]|uniref:hypothetical protein n=1 Tax=Ruegeria sp. TaxID=1879320 RepID=UPI003B00207C
MKRGRPVYCKTPGDWDRIRMRAASVGKSVSEFVMTCALHDSAPPSASALVLTPKEQRDLVRRIDALELCFRNLLDGRDDGGPSMVDEVTLLYVMQGEE